MKILEHKDGKLIAQLESKYPTRIVCSDDGYFLTEYKGGRNDKVARFIINHSYPGSNGAPDDRIYCGGKGR